MKLLAYLYGFIIHRSLATMTVVRFAPSNDVINVNDNDYSFESTDLKLVEVMGATYDIMTGRYWAITGIEPGKQELKELCKNSAIDIISPLSKNDNQLLVCLTSGISGVFSIDMISFQYGELNTRTGKWKAVGSLPPPTDNTNFIDAFTFAQDNYGTLHYINGDGNYFTKKKKDKDFKRVHGTTFPIVEVYLGCGEFIDDDTIASTGKEGNIFEFSISKRTAISKVVESGTNLMDVTNGPLSDVCPARTLTALADSGGKSVFININSASLQTSFKYALDKIVGITHDSSSRKVYAITKPPRQRRPQTLKRLCKSSRKEVARISPPNVELRCLTSGKRGVFAIDMQGKQFGKLDIKTAKFESIGDINGPYNAYAFALDHNGVLHYINGDGKHYDTSKNKNKLMPSGVKFPSNNLGICGEFDGSDILSVSASGGGTVRYSFLKSTSYTQTEKLERASTDITSGSVTDTTCFNKPKSSKKRKKTKKKTAGADR